MVWILGIAGGDVKSAGEADGRAADRRPEDKLSDEPFDELSDASAPADSEKTLA
jgi:hypothetical protein